MYCPSFYKIRQALFEKAKVGNISILSTFKLVRVIGIEPMTSAWKADVLPLNYTRKKIEVISDSEEIKELQKKMHKTSFYF